MSDTDITRVEAKADMAMNAANTASSAIAEERAVRASMFPEMMTRINALEAALERQSPLSASGSQTPL